MRIVVRVVGIALMVCGIVIWADDRSSSSPAMNANPSPPVSHLPSLKPTNSTAPKPEIVRERSSVIAYQTTDFGRLFHVDLYKSDGWFDTGIPVQADLRIIIFQNTPVTAPGLHWVEGRVGQFQIDPDKGFLNAGTIVDTTVEGHETRDIAPNLQYQIAKMSADEEQTLKLRVTFDGPEVVKFEVNVVNSLLEDGPSAAFTISQQREKTALDAWRPR